VDLDQIEPGDHERQPYQQGTDCRRRRAGERAPDADDVDDGKDDVQRQLGPGVERAARGADLLEEVGDLRGGVAQPEAIRRRGAAEESTAEQEERECDEERDEPRGPGAGFQPIVHRRQRGGRRTAGASEASLKMVELTPCVSHFKLVLTV